jgi:uncharacterized coiled-coil protein SlyX
MISENRDILIERLEHKLSEKEREIDKMRDSLKESIITELREGMKDDLDLDKRISHLEKKVKDMGLAYDGVMKELLDQKTVIQDFKKTYIKNDIVREVPSPEKPKTGSDWPDTIPTKDKKEQFIIAESKEKKTLPPETKTKTDIIIARRESVKSGKKGDVVVEARDDEDVVIEYKK